MKRRRCPQENSLANILLHRTRISDLATMEEAYLLFCPLLVLISWFLRPSLANRKLPPGPRPWPLIGNLPRISRQRPHADMADLARLHGPLLSLRLGSELVVVASSPAAAVEVLKTHDRNLSSRFVPHTYRIEDYTPFSLPFAVECDEKWKALRSVCKSELFTVKTLDMHSQLREEKVCQLVESLVHRQGTDVKIGELVFKTIFNMLGNLILSRDVFDEGKNDESNSLKSIFSRVLELGLAMNVADFYPALAILDIQGLNRECTAHQKKIYQTWDALIEERAKDEDAKLKFDFLSILLSANLEHNQIMAMFTDMFVAGTDTSTTAIEWTMTELIKNPEAMAKARSEAEMVVGRRKREENMVKESHLSHLKYTHACIKEALRLHPVVPLLLPRQAKEECKVMNYTIPKGTRVMVNVWAIGRDPAVWRDPEKFMPERFVESGKDYKGNDFDFTPFGAGRRICPGIPLASRLMPLIIASLIHTFDWSLPMGMKPEDVDVGEKFGLVLEKAKPLVLVPTLD